MQGQRPRQGFRRGRFFIDACCAAVRYDHAFRLHFLTMTANQPPITLANLDLSVDPAAQRVTKNEIVDVQFATAPGSLMSLEGANRYAQGDALITGATGERWAVSRDRFDAKYVPREGVGHGNSGEYTNKPSVVLAKRMDQPFSIARSANGDVLRGDSGDWVMQYAPGDYGVVKAARFAKVYKAA